MTQDISSTPAESEPCMWGRATLVMLVSRTCMMVTIITERVMAHRRAGEMGVSGAGAVAAVTRAWYRVTRRLVTFGPSTPAGPRAVRDAARSRAFRSRMAAMRSASGTSKRSVGRVV